MFFRIVISALSLFLLSGLSSAGDLQLADNGLKAGYMTLAWPDADGEDFILKQKTEDGWRIIYAGPDRASTLSGYANGDYEFALLADRQAEASQLKVTVAHHPLKRAFTFFTLGAAMFIILIVLIVRGLKNASEPLSVKTEAE